MRLSLSTKKSKMVAALVVVTLAAGGVATATFAGEGDDVRGEEAAPGVPYDGVPPNEPAPADESGPDGGGESAPLVTSSGTYEPTILTKFIPGVAFVSTLGNPLDAGDTSYDPTEITGNCLTTPAFMSGFIHSLRAPVELPDGARIKQIIGYGEDSSAGFNITFRLVRVTESFGLFGGDPSPSTTNVTSFTTSAAGLGEFAVSSADNLAEDTGNVSTTSGVFPFILFNFEHRFHFIEVNLDGDADLDHELCGVEVQYQVPSISSAAAQAYYPISPVRAFDSRIAGYAPDNTVLTPGTSRVISIKDGHDAAGAVNLADVVPSGATAVTYNLTVAGPTGPNFLAITPGDAGSFTASAINFNGTADLANGGTAAIASDRTIKVWCGDQTGSTHIIIDITGFYAPLPNMGN